MSRRKKEFIMCGYCGAKLKSDESICLKCHKLHDLAVLPMELCKENIDKAEQKREMKKNKAVKWAKSTYTEESWPEPKSMP